jgi:predicted MPP superfamily phosphohydrolase
MFDLLSCDCRLDNCITEKSINLPVRLKSSAAPLYWNLTLHSRDKKEPDTEWLKDCPDGYKILLSHHPEYYPLIEPYADLILSGHAHGGQFRLFGRGLFAPGQGFLPRYSKGMYGKMCVSAGLTNTTWVPRINNPTELVIVEGGLM